MVSHIFMSQFILIFLNIFFFLSYPHISIKQPSSILSKTLPIFFLRAETLLRVVSCISFMPALLEQIRSAMPKMSDSLNLAFGANQQCQPSCPNSAMANFLMADSFILTFLYVIRARRFPMDYPLFFQQSNTSI